MGTELRIQNSWMNGQFQQVNIKAAQKHNNNKNGNHTPASGTSKKRKRHERGKQETTTANH